MLQGFFRALLAFFVLAALMVSREGKQKTVYEVTFEGKVHQFGRRFRLQRWLKRQRERQEEQQMSWAERHVRWMIEHNCDDHGNPWPD